MLVTCTAEGNANARSQHAVPEHNPEISARYARAHARAELNQIDFTGPWHARWWRIQTMNRGR